MLDGTIDPIDLDIAVIVQETMSAEARSFVLASVAREQLGTDEQVNARALGYVPDHTTTVDGMTGGSEDKVRADGVIIYAFDLLPDIFAWIYEQLRAAAPVLSGRFRDSFELYADGVLVDPKGSVPMAREYVFLSTVPYARRIEGDPSRDPESAQAPDGVFEVIAVMAQQRFGNQVNIRFSFRAPIGGVLLSGKPGNDADFRTPAIVITGRG
jgi:hypothetical protein